MKGVVKVDALHKDSWALGSRNRELLEKCMGMFDV